MAIETINKDELDTYRKDRVNRIEQLKNLTNETAVEMKTIHCKIPLSLYTKLKVYSCQTIKTVSQVIELALIEYLKGGD